MMEATTFGAQVRARRAQLGLTRRQLSRAVICAEVTLRKIEDDERRPSPQMAQRLADSLMLAPDERERFIAAACTRQIRPLLASPPQPALEIDRLLALAESSFLRYPDETQQSGFDMLEKHSHTLHAALRSLLRADPQAAQRLAGALSEFWMKRGRLSEGRGWLEQALLLDVASSAARAVALFGAGRLAAFQADFPHARRRLDECWLVCRRLKLDALQARVVDQQGWIALWGDGNPAEAARLYGDGLRRHEALGDALRSAHTQCDLALALTFSSPPPDLAQAGRLATGSLARFRALGNPFGAAFALHVMTQVETTAGRIAEAETLEMEALALFQQLNSPRDVAWSLAHLGDLALLRGDLQRARSRREQSLELFHGFGDTNAVCITLHALAQIAREQGDLASAARQLAAGMRTALELHNGYLLAHGFHELAGIRLALGSPGQAAELLGAGEALLKQVGRVFPAHEAERFAAWAAAARAALETAEYEAAVQRGAALPLAQAVLAGG